VGIALLVLVFVGYALFSRRLEHSSLTGPMIFTIAGVVAGLVVLAQGGTTLGLARDIEIEAVQLLLEVTLVIILFSDAVLIDVTAVRKEASLPFRLLGIGLPLTIAAGTAVAMIIFPDLGFWPAVVIAVILAPTDAALGQAVVSNERVPAVVRQGLGVESGLNDGIAVPFLAIAVAGAANEMQSGSEIVLVFVEEIGLAIIIGLAIGWLGGRAVLFACEKGWMGSGWRQVSVILFALLSFAVADPVGGSGFIAAFVGGLTFGAQVRRRYPDISEFSEGVAHVLTMSAFLVFGAFILTPVLNVITWRSVLYAILSLTLVRMIPVALSLVGTRLEMPTQLYVGWFGPRGLASLVFMGTVVVGSSPDEGSAIIAVAATTVALSVLLHGVTAWPMSARYAAWFSSMSDDEMDDMVEAKEVVHLPTTKSGGPMRRSR